MIDLIADHYNDKWMWTLLGIFLNAVLFIVGHLAAGIVLTILVVIVITVFRYFVPTRKIPRSRVRFLRIRLALRAHPGRGFATTWSVRRRFSARALARREGRYIRPALTASQLRKNPDAHSFDLGKAHLRQEIRLPYNRNVVILAPPRMRKSAALAEIMLDHPGSVLSTSTKDDQFRNVSGVRQRFGPQFVFNPMGVGHTPSNVRTNPVRGCADESTAYRRAAAFCEAANSADLSNGGDGFWDDQASDALAGLMCAADLVGADMRLVQAWALGNPAMAVHVLERADKRGLELALYEFAFSPAEKTTSTIRMVLKTAFGFMRDPKLAECVLPGSPEDEFNFVKAVADGSTLYLIGDSVGKSSPMAALFAWMAMEWKHAATVVGSKMPGGRLDPPTLMAVDEASAICPIPLPTILQDCAGQGIQVISVAHGIAQMEGRWKETGRRTILDTSSILVLPGVKDPELLKLITDICGKAFLRERGQEAKFTHHDLMTADMIRQLPDGHGLLISDNNPPAIVRLGNVWSSGTYKAAQRAGTDIAMIEAATSAPMLEVSFNWAGLLEQARRELPAVPVSGPADGSLPPGAEPSEQPRRRNYGPTRGADEDAAAHVLQGMSDDNA